MTDRSSQHRRARTGEDAQRVACARATFWVGRGGYTVSSMYCDTNLGKIVARSTSNSYIRCFQPQPFVPACPIPCPCLRKSSVCACLPYFLCLNRFELSGFCVQSARWVSGFLATRVLPRAIGHSILRISVKPRCIPLSNSQDPELVLLSSHLDYPSGIDPGYFDISTLKNQIPQILAKGGLPYTTWCRQPTPSSKIRQTDQNLISVFD